MTTLNISIVSIFGLLTITMIMLIIDYINLPEVYEDIYGNCVRVINYGSDNYNCENLPSKYNHYVVG